MGLQQIQHKMNKIANKTKKDVHILMRYIQPSGHDRRQLSHILKAAEQLVRRISCQPADILCSS